MKNGRVPLRTTLALSALIVASAVAYGAWSANPGPRFHGTTYEEVAPAPDFRLVDHDGRPVTLASYRGHPVLLFFGFTHCPDVCPTTMSRLGRVIGDLGGRAEDVRVLLVTIDPARDTPAVMKEYVRRFGPFATGLTGDSAAVAAAMAGYGAYVMPPPPTEGPAAAHGAHAPRRPGAMPHTSVVYGIDREGRLRVVISDAATEEQTRDDVRALARL
ncbi:MAG TPA: SCO family protein [Longimicrobium sp.]|nr:SCO family protein [Longimicrobium sp.]